MEGSNEFEYSSKSVSGNIARVNRDARNCQDDKKLSGLSAVEA